MRNLILLFLMLGVVFTLGYFSLRDKLSTKEIEFEGQVNATTISINSPFSGTINEIYFKRGELVEKGEKLFTINIFELDEENQQAGIVSQRLFDVVASDTGVIFEVFFSKGDSVISNNSVIRMLIKDTYHINTYLPLEIVQTIPLGSNLTWMDTKTKQRFIATVNYKDLISDDRGNVLVSLSVNEQEATNLVLNQKVKVLVTKDREDTIFGIKIPEYSLIYRLI